MTEGEIREGLGDDGPDGVGGCGLSSDYGFNYLIVSPHKGSWGDLLRYAVSGDAESGARFLEGSEHPATVGDAADHRWVIVVSVIVRRIFSLFRKPMARTGDAIDILLNLLSQNGGIFGLLLNLVLGKLVIPQRGTETFISTIGQLDTRIDLYRGADLAEVLLGSSSAEGSMKLELGNRALMDLCIMAAKLAYENAKVVENVVHTYWKMHFVEFLNCWNDYQEETSTQVFIFCDRPKDANLIMISFRGTEPFDADDWCTDFDYSWYEIPELGKVHMGFLEALGLGNRADILTFRNNLLLRRKTSVATSQESSPEMTPPRMAKRSAYYTVRQILRDLLQEHKNAKVMVTGHSLGGALAILFPTVLVLHEESEMISRLLGVYTFGQPRVGDRRMSKVMKEHLGYPVQKYFRVVYCNDIVPRLPYDDKTFLYKHFGVCLYYDSFYNEKHMGDEPNPNYSGLRCAVSAHLNAVWELVRGLMMGYMHGPEYKEGWFRVLMRVFGLFVPGVSAHCPTDYVNSVRLGTSSVVRMSSL